MSERNAHHVMIDTFFTSSSTNRKIEKTNTEHTVKCESTSALFIHILYKNRKEGLH